MLDLGTHVGTFTLAAAALGYEVIGVEASPQNAALLRAGLEHNAFRHVQLINAAVGDRPGTLEFSRRAVRRVGPPRTGPSVGSRPGSGNR